MDSKPPGGSKFLRFAVYIRVSTDEQAKEEHYSLSAQEHDCTNLIRQKSSDNWVYVLTISDAGYSGSTMERPGLLRLLAMIKRREIDGIVVYKRDRLFRNADLAAHIQTLFDTFGTIVCSLKEGIAEHSPHGVFFRQVLDSQAELERATTKMRVHDALIHGAKKGDWKGGIASFGYSYTRGTKTLQVNESEAQVIRQIFESIAAGDSLCEVAATLRKNGIMARYAGAVLPDGSKRSNYFTVTAIRRIIENPTYRGIVRVRATHAERSSHSAGAKKWVEYRGRHAPLVSDEVWFRANQMIAAVAIETPERHRYVTSEFAGLLVGKVRCACCNASMCQTITSKRRPEGPDHNYYRCTYRIKCGRESGCSTGQISANALDTSVITLITMVEADIGWLERFGYNRSNKARESKITELQAASLKIVQQLSEKRNQVENLVAYIRGNPSGVLTSEVISDADRLQGEIAKIEFERIQVDSQLHRLLARVPDVREIRAGMGKLARSLGVADRVNKRRLLAEIISGVTVRRIVVAKMGAAPLKRTYQIVVRFKSNEIVRLGKQETGVNELVRYSDFELGVSLGITSNRSTQEVALLEPQVNIVTAAFTSQSGTTVTAKPAFENPIQKAVRWRTAIDNGKKGFHIAHEEGISAGMVSIHVKLLALPQLILDFMVNPSSRQPTTPISLRELMRLAQMDSASAVSWFHARIAGAPLQQTLEM